MAAQNILALSGVCVLCLLSMVSAFSPPLYAPQAYSKVQYITHGVTAANRPTALRSLRTHVVQSLRMQEHETEDNETDKIMQAMAARQGLAGGSGPVAINLEGHYTPNMGFVPHAFKVDGDFELKYDAATSSATTSVEVVGVGPTYEDFVAGFTAESDVGWSVDPSDGCLDVAGGDPDELQVKYSGPCESRVYGTLVVVLPAVSSSYTFTFRVEP